jgi:ABC-2 type transport system ATP-binding protein
MEEADTLCDRVAIMRHGKVILEGAPLQLRAEIGAHATLEDVFIAHSGPAETEEGGFRDTARTRSLARRLG